MHYYYSKVMADETDLEAAEAFKAHIAHREFFDELYAAVFSDYDHETAIHQPEDFECLRFMINSTEKHCGRLDDYTLKFVKHFVHTCETSSTEEINDTVNLITAM